MTINDAHIPPLSLARGSPDRNQASQPATHRKPTAIYESRQPAGTINSNDKNEFLNFPDHHSLKTILALLFIILLPFSTIRAQTTNTSTTQSSEPNFEVHEWAVFFLDASQNEINPDGTVTCSLPDFIDSRRQSAPTENKNDPEPLAVIRLTGQYDSSVDVMVEKSTGDFLASWPKAESRQKQLLWRDLKLSNQPPDQKTTDIDPNNWLSTLRDTDSNYLTLQDKPPERFLLYDFKLPCNSPITVKNEKNFKYAITNSSKSTLHDLTLYQGDQSSFRQASLGDLPPLNPPSTKPATQPTTPQPTTKPAQLHVQLTPVPATQPSDLAAPWKPKLLAAGISDADADVILKILTRSAFDSRLSAICLVDETTMDRLLPLEVVPEPKKITRTAIVIIKHADPNAPTEIDDLITQLGDPAWSKRDAAYKALQKLGSAAQPKLRDAAAKSKDLEIVWRAERLLQTPQQSPQ
jgi:hypothetical protein